MTDCPLSFDLDYKDSCGVIPNSIEELAYNATSVAWSPHNQPVKVRQLILISMLYMNF